MFWFLVLFCFVMFFVHYGCALANICAWVSARNDRRVEYYTYTFMLYAMMMMMRK